MKISDPSLIYGEEDTFAGWPANHGAWQWGDELLFGFMRGPMASGGMHKISTPYQKVLARSKDGGATWGIEEPFVSFDGCPEEMQKNIPDTIDHQAGDVIRLCGIYDTGGELAYTGGAFYHSTSRGKDWGGPYPLVGLEDLFVGNIICTARTRVLDDLIFLSLGNSKKWGVDQTFICKYSNGKFDLVTQIPNLQDGRAVMPAVAKLGDRIYCALRRKGGGNNWIDIIWSDDGGVRWSKPMRVADTVSHNGNPPALVAVGDSLYCFYMVRPRKTMCCTIIGPGHQKHHIDLLSEKRTDGGYPQAFVNSHGEIVLVFYWCRQTGNAGGEIVKITITP